MDRFAQRGSSVLAATFQIGIAVVLFFPFFWMVTTSLKSSGEVLAWPPVLIPRELHWDNIARVFSLAPFARMLLNSAYISVLVVGGVLAVSILSGYAFARIRFPGRSLLLVVLLSALLMPTEAILIPLYALFDRLGWLGTHLPLIVAPIFGTPSIVGTFLMRQHFLGFPAELEDAARIDGLGRFGILWRIATPLAKPALASVIILTFLSTWNAFIEPLVFVGGPDVMLTAPVGLTRYVDGGNNPLWEVQMAATSISVLPVLAVFVLAQRAFVQGIARVGIHG